MGRPIKAPFKTPSTAGLSGCFLWPDRARRDTLLHMGRADSAGRRTQPVIDARIPEDDPAWQAAMNAPLDDTADTEQERADLEEARASGRFVSGAEVRRAIASRPR